MRVGPKFSSMYRLGFSMTFSHPTIGYLPLPSDIFPFYIPIFIINHDRFPPKESPLSHPFSLGFPCQTPSNHWLSSIVQPLGIPSSHLNREISIQTIHFSNFAMEKPSFFGGTSPWLGPSAKPRGRHHSSARSDGGPLQPGPHGPHLPEAAEAAARPGIRDEVGILNGMRCGRSLGFNVI